MSDEDFNIELSCCTEERLKDVLKHSQAALYPNEVVTQAIELHPLLQFAGILSDEEATEVTCIIDPKGRESQDGS